MGLMTSLRRMEAWVFIQMCVKGMRGKGPGRDDGITFDDACAIATKRGLVCAWWRNTRHISPAEIDARLTDMELDLHINSSEEIHPTRGGLVKDQSPFISLTAGQVERKKYLAQNSTHPAQLTALKFATDSGTLQGECFLFYCWVMVGMRPNVPVRHLAEEVRELNTYTEFSWFQLEGEIAAKIEVPPRQIEKFEHYECRDRGDGLPEFRRLGTVANKRLYIHPHDVTNYRPMLHDPDWPGK
jgi:hypothetical protein